jgi:hypothetical protein
MRKLILTTSLVFSMALVHVHAQQNFSFAVVDSQSYALYQKADWKTLLTYGKLAIANKQDFLLLRLRTGYAAFMIENYSEAIKHYEAVLREDKYNNTAHYFIYWSRINLGQPELAMAEAKFIAKDAIDEKKLKPSAITGVEAEFSFKRTSTLFRSNPFYARIGLANRFNPSLHMQQSVATYQQQINEPLLTSVADKEKININQFEYYNRFLLNLDRHWQIKAAYHYLYTPFNNYTYNNHLLLLGVKYNSNYFDLQADAVIGKLTDTATKQFNLQLGLYPAGNLNFYSFSTAMLRLQGSTAFNFRQVIGVKLVKDVWLEGNITLGEFRNLVENDALYVYHAIDPNTMKAGITSYILLGSKTTLQLGYTYEKRRLFNTTNEFHQHSITGGLSWKF